MIRVASIAGLATVQDEGRPGWMHRGIPPGGPLVPDGLARANRAAGNAGCAACIELVGAITLQNDAEEGPVQVARGHVRSTVLQGAIHVGIDDGRIVSIAPGAATRIASDGGRPRYIAPRGGIDVPIAWGGRGTLLVAHVGGLEGRALVRGDRLALAADIDPKPCAAAGQDAGAPTAIAPLRVIAGPDIERFEDGALDVLLGSVYRVSPASNRVGARLVGPALRAAAGASSRSRPMVRGAIEVPPSGEPIILGPDHPTTGGYPVIAVVVRADVGAVYAAGIGGSVRFALAESTTR